jgi:hypothetical protein
MPRGLSRDGRGGAVVRPREHNVAIDSHAPYVTNLFLVDDVPQNKVGQLRHQRPQPGVLLQQ